MKFKANFLQLTAHSYVSNLFRYLSIWVLFCAYLVWELLPNGTDTIASGARIGDPVDKVSTAWPAGADYGSYFQAALSWREAGVLIDPIWHWVLNLWPPGMVAMNNFALNASGDLGRPLIAIVSFVVLTWATLLTLVCIILMRRARLVLTLVLMFGILSTYPFEGWIFGQFFALPTGFAVGFVGIALFIINYSQFVSSRKKLFALYLLAGLLFLLSAFMRVTTLASVYIILVFLLLFSVLFVVHKKHESSQGRAKQTRTLFALLIISAVTMIGVQSWTSYVTQIAHPGVRSYTVSDPTLAYGNKWRPDSLFTSTGNGWLGGGNTNWACQLEKEQCVEISQLEESTAIPYSGLGITTESMRNQAILAAVKNPIEYLTLRMPIAWYYWSANNVAEGILFLVVLLAALRISVVRIVQERDLTATIFLSLVLGSLLPLLWVHFYYYYFSPAQILSAIYLVLETSRNTNLPNNIKRID